jgi:8-oxo-dGTP diphosphatase
LGTKEQGTDATDGRWLTIPRTLCFITNGDDVLLMKRGANRRIFPNCYNGVGGHIERDEDPLSCIKREIQEETGLGVHSIRLRAIHNIDVGTNNGIIMFVFTAISDKRKFIDDGREGTLHWIARDEIMSLNLVEDLPQIIPRVLSMGDSEQPFFVHVSYDDNDVIQMRFTSI